MKKIRQAKMTDLDEITAAEAMCFPFAEAATRESFEKRLRIYPECFLVAEEEGRIIGYINGCVTNERAIRDEMFTNSDCHKPDGDFQTVFGLVVLPECRGRSVARELMNELIELTKNRGKKGLVLTCKEHLLDYYKSFGYKNSGRSESALGGAVWYDMILEFLCTRIDTHCNR